MRIFIFVFILCTLCSSSFEQPAQPSVFCQYGGAVVQVLHEANYTFSIKDVLERCDIISYGGTFFNSQPDPEDAKAITELKAAGKTVYMLYMNESEADWAKVISSTDTADLDNYIAPMLNYVNENSIDGIILAYLELFSGQIPNYATKISGFLSKIKECVPNLKICLLVTTDFPTDYGNKELFDFTVVDPLVDIYFIDVALKNYCDASVIAANGGRLPLNNTGPNDTRFNLEKVCNNVKSSSMATNKLYVCLNVAVSKEIPNSQALLSYTDYCGKTVSKTDVYCLDSMQQFYDTVKYAKKYFKGILLYQIDFDDYNSACGCGLFPVSNAYIDGWKNEPLKCCDKIG